MEIAFRQDPEGIDAQRGSLLGKDGKKPAPTEGRYANVN